MELQPALSSRRGKDEAFALDDVDLDNLDLDDLLLDDELSNFLEADILLKSAAKSPSLDGSTPGFSFSYPFPGGNNQQQHLHQQLQSRQQPGIFKNAVGVLKDYFFPSTPQLDSETQQAQFGYEDVYTRPSDPDFDPFLLDQGYPSQTGAQSQMNGVMEGMDPGMMLGTSSVATDNHTSSSTFAAQVGYRSSGSFTRGRSPRPSSPTSSPSPSPYPGGYQSSTHPDISKKRKLADGPVTRHQQQQQQQQQQGGKQAPNGTPQPETSAESILQGSVVTSSTPEDMLKALNESFAQQSEVAAKKKLELKRQMRMEGLDEREAEKRMRKKENHTSLERKRRDNLNDCILDLAKMVPDGQETMKLNKGGLLRKAVDHMEMLKDRNQELEEQLRMAIDHWTQSENKHHQMAAQLAETTKKVKELTTQNAMLFANLKKNGRGHAPSAQENHVVADMDMELSHSGAPPGAQSQMGSSPTQFLSKEVISGDADAIENFIQGEIQKQVKDTRRKRQPVTSSQ